MPVLSYRKDGSAFWNKLQISYMKNEMGESVLGVALVSEISREAAVTLKVLVSYFYNSTLIPFILTPLFINRIRFGSMARPLFRILSPGDLVQPIVLNKTLRTLVTVLMVTTPMMRMLSE